MDALLYLSDLSHLFPHFLTSPSEFKKIMQMFSNGKPRNSLDTWNYSEDSSVTGFLASEP